MKTSNKKKVEQRQIGSKTLKMHRVRPHKQTLEPFRFQRKKLEEDSIGKTCSIEKIVREKIALVCPWKVDSSLLREVRENLENVNKEVTTFQFDYKQSA